MMERSDRRCVSVSAQTTRKPSCSTPTAGWILWTSWSSACGWLCWWLWLWLYLWSCFLWARRVFTHTCMWRENGPKRWISVGWIICKNYFTLYIIIKHCCASGQIRRALMQLLFPGKTFHWLRHIIIAVCLLFAVNLLVIFVPNIRDIFGIIGGI